MTTMTAEYINEKWKYHWGRHLLMAVGFAVVVILIVGRLYLPYWVKDFANETLNNVKGYRGSVEDIDIHLYRGAYTIHGLKLFKLDKGIPVPFLDFAVADLSIQWGALLRGEIVGDVTLERPVINFAVSQNGASAQTGIETDWTVPIKELMPLDINWVDINNGKITYQDFSASPKVDLFIDNLEARATNLRNVDDKNAALPSTVTVRGTSIGTGKIALDGKMNILKKIPDFDLDGKLESVNLTAMNDYARDFAGIDFEAGQLNIYSELIVKDGRVTGYVKPLATGIRLIDAQPSDPVSLLWESMVSIVLEIFENQKKDQFATQIELEGNLNNPQTNIWSTIGGILRNAFGQAFSKTIKPE